MEKKSHDLKLLAPQAPIIGATLDGNKNKINIYDTFKAEKRIINKNNIGTLILTPKILSRTTLSRIFL